jgi:hypothetical protein
LSAIRKANITASVQGVRETLQLLDGVQPGSIKELRKEIKTILEPTLTAIKANVPSSAPLSGMNHYGRTRFGRPQVKSTLLTAQSRYRDTTPLIRIEVVPDPDSVGFEIADMAGRRTLQHGPKMPYQYTGRGRRGGSGRQDPTKSRPVVRRGNARAFSYRINGQGTAMIRNLSKLPSRYVYPPVENNIFRIRDDMLQTLEKYVERINHKLKVR